MRPLIALAFVFVLTACAPVRTYYAEGVSLSVFERDGTRCDVAALKDAPVASVVVREPPRYIRTRRCDANGSCYTSGGYWLPGEVYTYDANADLRARVKGQCMADAGYRPVEIPQCPTSVAEAAPNIRTTIFPPLNETSCVIRYKDGGIQIVERG